MKRKLPHDKPILSRKKKANPRKAKRKTLFKALLPDETDRLLNAIINPRDRHAVMLCLNTGLRVGELTGLVWKDVWDFSQDCPVETMTIRPEIAKRKKERVVPLNLKAREALVGLVKLYGKINPPDSLLTSRKGGGLSARQFERVIREGAKTGGISRINVTPHVLRHTFATNVLKAGCDVMTLKELLGHSDVSTTMIYTHIDSAQKRRAVDGI